MDIVKTIRRCTVLAVQDKGTNPCEIVLCEIKNELTPFVTWWRNLNDGALYWGHYHGSETAANIDFNERCLSALGG